MTKQSKQLDQLLRPERFRLNGNDRIVDDLAKRCQEYRLPPQRKILLIFPVLSALGAIAGFIYVLVMLRQAVGWETTYTVMGLAAISFVFVAGTFVLVNRQLPPWIMGLALLWGAGISPAVALVFNELGASYLAKQDFGVSSYSSLSNTAFIVAPLVEEGIKGLGIALILWGWRKYLLTPMAGVVCAGLIAAGFAYTENLLYLARGDALVIFIVRGVFTPYAHSLFSTATGLAIGYALTRVRRGKLMVGLCGWGIAVCLHALWNSVTGLGSLTFIGLLFIWWGPYFTAWFSVLIVTACKHNTKIALGIHPFYRAGWVNLAQAELIYSQSAYRKRRKEIKQEFGAFLRQLKEQEIPLSYGEIREYYRQYRQYRALLKSWRSLGRKLALSYLRIHQSGRGGEYYAYCFWQAQLQLHQYEQSFPRERISNPIIIYPHESFTVAQSSR